MPLSLPALCGNNTVTTSRGASMEIIAKVDRLVGRVQRRLFFHTLLAHLLWSLAAGFLVAAVWIFLLKLLFPDAETLLIWSGAASMVLGGALVAAVLSWLQRPLPIRAALSIDERCGFKERLTTLLSLSSADRQSPAGAALLADIN